MTQSGWPRFCHIVTIADAGDCDAERKVAGRTRGPLSEAGLAMIKAQGGIFGSVAGSKPLLNALAGVA
jgi:hypothetical protein